MLASRQGQSALYHDASCCAFQKSSWIIRRCCGTRFRKPPPSLGAAATIGRGSPGGTANQQKGPFSKVWHGSAALAPSPELQAQGMFGSDICSDRYRCEVRWPDIGATCRSPGSRVLRECSNSRCSRPANTTPTCGQPPGFAPAARIYRSWIRSL